MESRTASSRSMVARIVSLSCEDSELVLLLIVSLAAFLLWLLGTAEEQVGLHRRLDPTKRIGRVYSKLFLARQILVLERRRDQTDLLMQSISDVARWFTCDHDVLFVV